MSDIIEKYDDRGNVIYFKGSGGNEDQYKYEENKNLIYFKNSNGYESWREYDENNNEIHFKNSNGWEYWHKYDENNERIEITEQEFENIKIREYLSRKKVSRFELIDI